MKNKLLSLSFDGMFQGIFLGILSKLSVSSYITSSLVGFFVIDLVFAIVFAIVFYSILHKQTSNKSIILSSAISFSCFLLTVITLFVIQIFYPLEIFMPREVNNADGITLLFAIGAFIGLTMLLRLLVFGIVLIKNIVKKHNEQSRDSSLIDKNE